MFVKILMFGQIAEIIGTPTLILRDVKDTDGLRKVLHETYPALDNYKYAVAVERKIVHDNTILEDSHTVALLPPFSGG